MRIIIWGLILVVSAMAYSKVNQQEPLLEEVIQKEVLALDFDREKIYLLDYLNELREASGLVKFSTSSILEESAGNHANYIIENGKISHYENEDKLCFTGVGIGDRAQSVAYRASYVSENLSGGSRNYKESIDGLFAAIYHRFGFLDFKIDEIGIGINQNSLKRKKTTFVYNMGNSRLNQLCDGKSFESPGKYIGGACFDREFKIKESLFNDAFFLNKKNKSTVVIYPYNGQTDVPPAFFNETPDPLPEYDVSGFPVSISFNEKEYKRINLIAFKLFDSQNNELNNTLLYDHESDINQKFRKFEFALFPLERLDWNSTYNVKVEYIADDVKKEKKWSFTTRTFKEKLHTVTAKKFTFKVKKNRSEIFYFKPLSPTDILEDIEYPLSVDVTIIDNNTIQFTASDEAPDEVKLTFGEHKLFLKIE